MMSFKKNKKTAGFLCAALLCGVFFTANILTVSAEPAATTTPRQTTTQGSPFEPAETLPVSPQETSVSVASSSVLSETRITFTDSSDEPVKSESEPPKTTTGYGMFEMAFDNPKGVGTVIDKQTDYDWRTGIERQFITVQSRGGHVFYVVIETSEDENGVVTQNVYFLNTVDDWDLLAFSEDFPKDFLEVMEGQRIKNKKDYNQALEDYEKALKALQELQAAETDENGEMKQPTEQTNRPLTGEKPPEVPKQETPEKKPNNMMIVICVVVLVGIVAVYTMKKKKNGGKKAPEPAIEDDYDDDDDTEES